MPLLCAKTLVRAHRPWLKDSRAPADQPAEGVEEDRG